MVRFHLPFDRWLASLSRPPYPLAATFFQWVDDYGLPATDAEFHEALCAGLIPPPDAD